MRNKSGLMRDEKGQVLIWVIALMMLAALIIPPFVASAYSGLHTSSVQQEKMQEFYAADTGIEDALMWIQSDWNNVTIAKPGDLILPLGNSTVEEPADPAEYRLSDFIDGEWIPRLVNNCWVDVMVERNESTGNYTYFVYSTATNQDTGNHVKVRVHVSPAGPFTTWSTKTLPPIPIPHGCVSNNPFSYAMGSLEGDIALVSVQGDIEGDVYVNGDLNLIGGQNVVNGNVYSAGDLTMNQQSIVTGNASVVGNLVLEQQAIIGENAWGNESITVDSGNGIWGDAYARTDINVLTGSVQGSAWANHDVNVLSGTSVIYQSAYANNDINVNSGMILGWAYYLNSLNISGGGSVGDSEPLSQTVQVPEPILPQIGDASAPAYAASLEYLGNATALPYGGNYTPIDNKSNPLATLQISGDKSLGYPVGPVPVGAGGPIYINANLDLSNNAGLTLEGTVYVKGSITLGNNADVTTGNSTTMPNTTPKVLIAEGSISINSNIIAQTDQDMPLIMSLYGSIECWNNSVINAALYAPNGTVYIHNNAYVDGAIVAQKITPIKESGQQGTKKYTVIYNEAVKNIPGLPYARIDVPGEPGELPQSEEVATEHFVRVYVDSYIVLEE
jgi:hypothetical protein